MLPTSFKALLVAGLGACIIYQAARIFPYTRLAVSEVDLLEEAPDHSKIKLLFANVQLENTRKAGMVRLIDREDPDVLSLMEADQHWLDAVQGCLNRSRRRQR
ncbi:hypothetical protein [Roseobacter sp.]|uniref:hypothetical protein n=1 Tax=Roseobacter sp. TaxID=1907202 RepID=UPI00329832C3